MAIAIPLDYSISMRIPSFVLLFVSLFIPLGAAAADIRGGEVLVISDNVADDLYAGGGQVEITGTVRGDAVIAGGELNVNGAVSEDFSAAGGRLQLRGSVGDDAHIAAGEVRIATTIGDDVFITGGRIELAEETVIDGDVWIAGGEVFIDGRIRGDLNVHAGRVVLRGTVEGDVEISAAEMTTFATILGESKLTAEKIILGSSSVFRGDVEYWTKEGQIDFTPVLDGAGAVYNPDLAPVSKNTARIAGTAAITAALMGIFLSLIFSIAFIILAVVVTKTAFADAAKRLRERPWNSFFSGILYFFLTPIFLLFLTITIVGLPLAVLGGVLYGFSIYFALPAAAIVLARMMETRLKKHWNVWVELLVSILMFVFLNLIGFIPVFGWLFVLFATCATSGALLHTKWQKLKKIR
jgi:cytoskeletal protein CcmA (bactofilin family)